jgi:hypothetical protein
VQRVLPGLEEQRPALGNKNDMETTKTERRLAYMLRAAVIDAQRVEHLAEKSAEAGKPAKLELDMWTFLKRDGRRCYVCMGGAHAILGMRVSSKVDDYTKWPELAKRAAEAVDKMRQGRFRDAAEELGLNFSQVSRAKAATASSIINAGYMSNLGRASWERYLRAACVLLGEKDPGASS